MATVILSHKIALAPTVKQDRYFRRACGVARLAYNWSLAEWKRQYAAGEKPSAVALSRQFNFIKKSSFPWMSEITKCAPTRAVADLGVAYARFFKGVSKRPRFKRKGKDDSFYLNNDCFSLSDNAIRIPKLGWVRVAEPLRYKGKIMSATVSLKAGRWFVSISVETSPAMFLPEPGTNVGIDLGVNSLMTLSRPLLDGTVKIKNPRARQMFKRRQSKLQRRISRQELVRRKHAGRASNRQRRRQLQLAKLHYRVANIRKDAIHKATTLIAESFETIYLEDLNVRGMAKNHSRAGSVLDAAFGEQRRQFTYKASMRGGKVVVIDRWFPSTKRCSNCLHVMDTMHGSVSEWDCPKCQAHHDRDGNAAKNIEMVGQAMSEPSKLMAMTTRGEMEALAGPSGSVKLPSAIRELERERAYALAS